MTSTGHNQPDATRVFQAVGRAGSDFPQFNAPGQTQLGGNQATYVKNIRRALARKLLVIVTGAGVSLNATEHEATGHLPELTWNGLILNGLQYLESEGYIGENDRPSVDFHRRALENSSSPPKSLMAAATYTKDELKQHGKWATWLDLVFKDLALPENIHKPGILQELREFQSNGAKIMTTNYDDLVDKICESKSIGPRDRADIQQFAAGDQDGVVHIHGWYKQAENVVFDVLDYGDITKEEVIQLILRALFATHTILFVGAGTGLQDRNFSNLLEWARSYYNHIPHKHYVLVRDKEDNEANFEPLIKVRYGQTYDYLVPFLHMLRDPYHLFGVWKFVCAFDKNSGTKAERDKPRAIATIGDGTPTGVFTFVLYDDRIQKYRIDYSTKNAEVPTTVLMAQWGSDGGSDNGQFVEPLFIWVSQTGISFVTDTNNHRVQVFNGDGEYMRQWGSAGTEEGHFLMPWGIWGLDPAMDETVHDNDNSQAVEIYVCDRDNKRVQIFDGHGVFKGSFGDPEWREVTAILVFRTELSNGRQVYLSDRRFGHVEEWCSSDGQNFSRVRRWGVHGRLSGEFRFAEGLAMCPHTKVIYVVDADNHRVQAFTDQGDYIHEFGNKGILQGQFDLPASVAVDRLGHVYVGDMDNYRVQVFKPLWSPSFT
jgi:hypothetical protein